MNTTSKRCKTSNQPCVQPYTCGDVCVISCPPCNSMCRQGRDCPATKREAAHDRAAQSFCSADADELTDFADENYRWVEPPRWPLYLICALAVAYGVACYYFPNF